MGEWKHKVRTGDVFANDELSFEERRDELVRRLRMSPAAIDGINGEELVALLEEAAETKTTDDFDSVWDDIYDLCDGGQWLWLEPF